MPSSSRLIWLASLVYVPLGIAAMAWAWFGDGRLAWVYPDRTSAEPYGVRLALSLGLGVVLGVFVVTLTPWLTKRAAWARALKDELEPIAKALSPVDIAALSMLSGTSEELFFRGAMQPALGLLLTSVIFGALHPGPKRAFLAWPLWAFTMGLFFGWIFEFTGVLLGPIFAHVFINWRNLAYMKRH